MALGDIYNLNGLVMGRFTMKSNTDAVKGKLYCDDGSGNGLVLATAALAAGNKVVMANEDHDYSEVSNHEISCVVQGYIEAAKIANSGLAKAGAKIMISGTAGECTKFVKGTVSAANTYATATDQAAIDTNIGDIGFATETSADADVTQKMFLGA
jgi:adenine-specific DNA methylase